MAAKNKQANELKNEIYGMVLDLIVNCRIAGSQRKRNDLHDQFLRRLGKLLRGAISGTVGEGPQTLKGASK